MAVSLISSVEGHRFWAESYDATPNPLLALEDRVLPGVLGRIESQRVVDVACGTGRWAARLSGAIGLDLCEEMLIRAAAKPGLGGRVLLGDANRIPIASAAADLTLCSFAIGYLPNLDQALAELARITRPAGRVVISDLHPASVAAGWTRSFRAHGAVVEMRHYPHSVADIVRAARRAGLVLESQRDVFFGSPEEAIFRQAGKPMPEIPALWIASWIR